MEQFKIKQFEHEHPSQQFPAHSLLTAETLTAMRRVLEHNLCLSKNSDGLHLVKSLAAAETIVPELNATDDDFDLRKVIYKFGVSPSKLIRINWHRFESVDEMSFDDLVTYFQDIWYPSSDDIDVWDSSMSWVLSIFHNGTVGFLRLNNTPHVEI